MEKLLFTSESVTEGHPDKLCDAVSDAILDACMEQDPMSRVACETCCCTGFVLVDDKASSTTVPCGTSVFFAYVSLITFPCASCVAFVASATIIVPSFKSESNLFHFVFSSFVT